ncbi:MAG: DUF3576 domain-containing protein [Pseudomonadota bacterium]
MSKIFNLMILLALITACNGMQVDRDYKDYHPQVGEDLRESKMKSIITKTDEPVIIYSNKKSSSETGTATGMAGSYLWKAAIETISFMPLISSDSNGGTIITDWYVSSESPNEEFKFNIFILSPELQIDSVKVTAFRQIRNSGGQWNAAPISKEIARNVEDNILKRAISMRVKSEGSKKK